MISEQQKPVNSGFGAKSEPSEVLEGIDLNGKVAMVTGGYSGIGLETARGLKDAGARVIVPARRTDVAKSELSGIVDDVDILEMDLADPASVTRFVNEFQDSKTSLDILINNAANDERHKIEDVTEEYWNDRINVNLRHYFFSVQSVRESMVKNKRGVIINVGSISWMIGQGGMAIYTAAKSAVVGLTRSFARDLGEYNIRVNSIVPGWTITERQIEKWLTPEAEADMMKKQCLKRRLMPSEIAKAILFFSSDQSSGCTNQSYIVDNGWY